MRRGWLLRLLGPVRDQDDFNRLDLQLVNALQDAGVDTSEPPLVELRSPRAYQPQQQQLEATLKNLGITKLLRDPLSAVLKLQSLLNHLPSGSNIEVLLQQEMDYYLSSCLQFTDSNGSSGSESSSREASFTRAGSGSDSTLPKLNGSGALRRQSSSSGPLAGVRGGSRTGSASVMEPYMVLRNDTVRSEWRSMFGSRERITWKEFWHKLVQPQVRRGVVSGDTVLLGWRSVGGARLHHHTAWFRSFHRDTSRSASAAHAAFAHSNSCSLQADAC